jgi:hypothetical protein
MRANISDNQQSSIISIVAKIPVAPARKPFLIELEKQLPKSGKVTDERLLQAINAALGSFTPGRWEGDEQGVRPSVDTYPHMTLSEAAALYQRMLKPPSWSWPPKAPLTPEEMKAGEAKLAAMSQEERAEAYARTLYPTEEAYQRHKRDDEAKRQAEETVDKTPWPLPSPPTTQVIRGEVSKDDEPEPPIVPLSERQHAKPPSIYGLAMMRLRGELPVDADDEERARALNEQLAKERQQRRRLGGAPKCGYERLQRRRQAEGARRGQALP